MTRLLFALWLALASSAGAAERSRWEIWDGCKLEAERYFDGDSFHVRHGSESAIIRLYFIDAPETDPTLAPRIAEQAAYFRAPATAILRAGGTAREFTAKFLSKPFRVITRREIAPGASRTARLYGLVERGGVSLDAALISAGLARASSTIADYPDAAKGQRAFRNLRALEAKAARNRLGIWAKTTRPVTVESLHKALQPRLQTGASAAALESKNPGSIRLNSASLAQLEALPGVGPKTAALLVRARPIADFNALNAVPGIGPKKLEALRPLVRFD